MYAAVLFVGFENSVTVQPVVAVERTVFYRERAAGMYSAIPYALAQVSDITLYLNWTQNTLKMSDQWNIMETLQQKVTIM